MSSRRDDTARREREVAWSRRIIVTLVVVGALVAVGLLGAAFLPRWWAQRIGDQVGGSMAMGILVGLFYGFLFSLLPLALLWGAARRVETWKGRGIALGIAALLAAPNLLTLGIVLGDGSGAHAGDRILDVEAPGFRGATLAGALVAAACLVAAWYLLASRRRAWRRVGSLETPPDEETPP